MSNYVDNHDQPRLLSRIGSDHPDHRARSAQAVAVFHTTLTGTIFVFQGQENGQINMPHSWGEEEYKDIESVEIFEGERERLKREGATQAEIDERIKWVLGNLRETARDNGRTPMQWDSSEHAGFSKGQPWMRVHDDYKQWNVKSQENDKQSVWSFWQAMLALRKKHLAIIYGEFILHKSLADIQASLSLSTSRPRRTTPTSARTRTLARSCWWFSTLRVVPTVPACRSRSISRPWASTPRTLS